jgi:hypothetical protein
MSYLKTVPRSQDPEPPARAVTVVTPGNREVVYLDESASIEVITEALRAWGIRVREERKREAAQPAPPAKSVEATWRTTRIASRTPTRLENVLSPLYFPIRELPTNVDPGAPWGWFGRAA